MNARWVGGVPHRIKAWALLSILLLAPFSRAGAKLAPKNDYILIISSYTDTSPWSRAIVNPVINRVASIEGLAVYTEYMNMLVMDNDEQIDEFKKRIFSSYNEHKPKVLLLIGSASLMLRGDIREHWGDIPVVLSMDRDYFGPDDACLERRPLVSGEKIPAGELTRELNMTLLQTPVYLRESVDLMQRMIPGMKELIFVSDWTFDNRQNDFLLRTLIDREYPGFRYRFFSSEEMSTDQLYDSLRLVDRETTGILFSSWNYKKTLFGNITLVMNEYKVVSTFTVPLFSLHASGFGENSGMLGGYFYDQQRFDAKLVSTIDEILGGRQPRDIPFYYPEDARPRFDYDMLSRYGFSHRQVPDGAVFTNMPPPWLEQYKYAVAGGLVLLVAGFVVTQSRRNKMLRRLSLAQQREIESNTRYTSLFDNMPILYMQEKVILGAEGIPVDTVYTDVNACFERRFGTRAQVVGKKGSELFPESMPDFLHFMRMALEGKRSITFPYYFRRIDTFYEVVLGCSYLPGVIDVFCIDSSELHRAQQKLASTNKKLSMALDVASIVPWKWNLRDRTILCDVNRPIELSTAVRSVEELQLSVPDKQYFAKICKEDRERVRNAYQDLIEDRTDKVREEYRVVSKTDKGLRVDWVEAQAAVESRDGDGRPLTLVGSSLVITERKRMEQELLAAKDRAEESNRLKSAFLANMSHEIRTPLNAIVGFSGILASAEGEQEKQEYVSIIENNNALLLQLISDILDLSKIEAGTLEFVYTDFDLSALMQEMEAVISMKVDPSKVALSVGVPQPVCFVRSEKNRISQLMINLLTNAAKFTAVGSIRFGYELRGSKLYFYVSDTGCGIPKEQQPSVFGRFVKLNRFEQGTGLGLSICQTIVEHMGGEIGVESEPGKGSTFWFTIPYVAGHSCDTSPGEFKPVAVEKDKLTILIAEDHESNYKLFESILSRDYRLLHAWDGRQAVEMYREHRPHIILMDINMPEMDGYEATREIRKLSADVPIIAVTAFAYASDEQRVLSNGFDGYMPKPINARQLREKIMEILRTRMTFV